RALDELAIADREPQVPLVFDRNVAGAVELHVDLAGIGAGLHDPVELQLPVPAVVFQVDAVVNRLVAHAAVTGNIGDSRTGSGKEIACAGLRLESDHFRRRVAAEPVHVQRGTFGRALDADGRHVAGQKEGKVRTARDEVDVAGRLSQIG